MILTANEQFAIILIVCVYVAWVIGYQWACETIRKEGGKEDGHQKQSCYLSRRNRRDRRC